jgi:hypothetical protein
VIFKLNYSLIDPHVVDIGVLRVMGGLGHLNAVQEVSVTILHT